MQEVASSNLVPNRSAVIALKSMYSGQFFRHGHRLSKTYNNVNLTPSYLWGLDDEVWRKRFAAYSPDNYKYTPRYEVARDIMLLTHSTSVRQSVNQSFSPVLFLMLNPGARYMSYRGLKFYLFIEITYVEYNGYFPG